MLGILSDVSSSVPVFNLSVSLASLMTFENANFIIMFHAN